MAPNEELELKKDKTQDVFGSGEFPTRASLLLYFLKGNKRYFARAVIFAALLALLDLVNPKIIEFTVDSVINDKVPELPRIVDSIVNAVGGVGFLRGHLYLIGLAVLIVAGAGALMRYLFRISNATGAESLVKRMRDLLYDHIIHLPFSWHGENQTGDIIQRCTSDVDVIRSFISDQLTSLFRISVLIVLAMYFMVSIEWRLALVSAAFIPVIMGYSYFFHSKIGESFQKVDIMEGQLSAIAQENLTGVRVVRAFGREKYERERFENHNRKYVGAWVNLMQILSRFWATGDLFSGLQVMLIVVFGAWFAVNSTMTAGEFIAFVSYNAMLTWPVRMLGRVISELSKAGISIDRIRYIMNSPVEKDRDGAQTPPMNRDIVFDHVSFSYGEKSPEVLDDVSFTVKAGSTVGILGGTGSGKSTLMYLLDRLYNIKPDEGRITVGGVDIADIRMEWIRKNVGMVLQEPYLFSRTLAENIAITQDSVNMDKIRHAAKMAMLDDTIGKFTKGYETFVGERGVTLSGGQKQRAAIAQMLIRQPAVMVFDDSLSAVDAETDAKIRHALEKETGDSTVILIAHRITTLMKADNIIVLDHGRVAESGTHEELLAMNGQYKRIYDLQKPEEE